MYDTAFVIFSIVLEKMSKATQFCDDSSGELNYPIDLSQKMMLSISSKPLSMKKQTKYFNYCIKAFQKELFKGCDWHVGILEIAYNFASDNNATTTLKEHLANVTDEFNTRRAKLLQLKTRIFFTINMVISNVKL